MCQLRVIVNHLLVQTLLFLLSYGDLAHPHIEDGGDLSDKWAVYSKRVASGHHDYRVEREYFSPQQPNSIVLYIL
jgi:hypothetical protein